jgi:hypothetical protein
MSGIIRGTGAVHTADQIQELSADELDRVAGGLRFAAMCGGGTLALGVEIGDTRYIVNIGAWGVSAFTTPAS